MDRIFPEKEGDVPFAIVHEFVITSPFVGGKDPPCHG
jgi:hypothetical protein